MGLQRLRFRTRHLVTKSLTGHGHLPDLGTIFTPATTSPSPSRPRGTRTTTGYPGDSVFTGKSRRRRRVGKRWRRKSRRGDKDEGGVGVERRVHRLSDEPIGSDERTTTETTTYRTVFYTTGGKSGHRTPPESDPGKSQVLEKPESLLYPVKTSTGEGPLHLPSIERDQ